MVASLRPFPELTGSQLGAWRALADRAAEPNPFFEPDFLLPATRHLDADGVVLAVVECDGAWLAAAPVRTRGPLRRTWVHTYCFLGTPLVDRDAVGAGLGGLIASLCTRTHPLLVLDTVALDGPVGAALAAALPTAAAAIVHEQRWERPALDLRDGGEWPGPPGKVRADLRRRRRRLGEELGGEVSLRDLGADPDAPDAFLELEASGWKGEGGTALGVDPSHAAFFRELCTTLTASGRLQLVAFGTKDQTVAMTSNLTSGDTAFGFKIAYDQRYRRQGPGSQLIAALSERIVSGEAPERMLDSCADASGAHLEKVMPHRRRLATVVVARRGLFGRLAGVGLRAGLALKERARRDAD